ncbi:hypothetical protein GTU79_03575 [Sodalis ligni]|uniref:hypothetical protein n=1 Tax=Sodalis ligni TaxID=2697027 RepID=UPI00193FADDF|nr:hypothetical protein [Sodalis ligni]QWA11883.1 hypothetical protein GTU79_03575 [Sodalis ligni]
MSFDIDKVLKEMLVAMLNEIHNSDNAIAIEVDQVLDESKEILAQLFLARKNGQLDDSDLQDEIKREGEVVKVQLLTLNIETEVILQKAVNAAIDVFYKAVVAAIP